LSAGDIHYIQQNMLYCIPLERRIWLIILGLYNDTSNYKGCAVTNGSVIL